LPTDDPRALGRSYRRTHEQERDDAPQRLTHDVPQPGREGSRQVGRVHRDARPTADSREEVDALADEALASGGSPAGEPIDVDFMYKRSFHDPDGHHWEVVWMNPAVLERSLAETGAAAS
jgi:hypothetical protein